MLACIIILVLVGSMFQHTQTVRSESECKYGELCTVFGQMCQILCVLGQVRVTEKTPTPFPPLSNTNPASTPSTRVTPTVSPPPQLIIIIIIIIRRKQLAACPI